jgi:hypothetical protein
MIQNAFAPMNQRTIRGPINPMDKSTIVSIYPRAIHEEKWTIQPGIFDIPAGSFEKPVLLVVGPSSWWRQIDDQQPLLEIPISSIQVADSIVKDYCNGILGCNMNDKMPGLFYMPGVVTLEELKKQHIALLQKYQQIQKNWFLECVRLADILWARTNGNPLAISDIARLACKELNILDKPWLKDSQTSELVRCKFCGNLKNPIYPICSVCHLTEDPELTKRLAATSK